MYQVLESKKRKKNEIRKRKIKSIIDNNYTNNNDRTYTYTESQDIIAYRKMFWRVTLRRQTDLLATYRIVNFISRVIIQDVIKSSDE